MGMETKVFINGAGHVTKISVTPIYGIVLKFSSLEPEDQ